MQRPNPTVTDLGMVIGDAFFGPYAAAVKRWELVIGRSAPTPTTKGRMSPRLVEWMMGLPEGWVTDTPGLSRTAMLRILGNGVVPQQAAAAYRMLAGDPVRVPVG